MKDKFSIACYGVVAGICLEYLMEVEFKILTFIIFILLLIMLTRLITKK